MELELIPSQDRQSEGSGRGEFRAFAHAKQLEPKQPILTIMFSSLKTREITIRDLEQCGAQWYMIGEQGTNPDGSKVRLIGIAHSQKNNRWTTLWKDPGNYWIGKCASPGELCQYLSSHVQNLVESDNPRPLFFPSQRAKKEDITTREAADMSFSQLQSQLTPFNYLAAVKTKLTPEQTTKLSYDQLMKLPNQEFLTAIRVTEVKQLKEEEMADKEYNRAIERLPKKRHYFIFGESNVGKTDYVKKILRKRDPNNFYKVPKNNDWKAYKGQKYIWFDEYKGKKSHPHISIQDINDLCDGELQVNVKTKLSKNVRDDCVVIIVSNFSLERVFEKEFKKDPVERHTLYNRFNVYEKISTTSESLPDLSKTRQEFVHIEQDGPENIKKGRTLEFFYTWSEVKMLVEIAEEIDKASAQAQIDNVQLQEISSSRRRSDCDEEEIKQVKTPRKQHFREKENGIGDGLSPVRSCIAISPLQTDTPTQLMTTMKQQNSSCETSITIKKFLTQTDHQLSTTKVNDNIQRQLFGETLEKNNSRETLSENTESHSDPNADENINPNQISSDANDSSKVYNLQLKLTKAQLERFQKALPEVRPQNTDSIISSN